MRNNVLRKVIIGIVACITLFALFVVYLAHNCISLQLMERSLKCPMNLYMHRIHSAVYG